MKNYSTIYQASIQNPEKFWSEVAGDIDWYVPWSSVLDSSNAPFYRWFCSASMNTCYNALDRHIENGHGERTALIYDSPVTDAKRAYSYLALKNDVACFAGALRAEGVAKGDRVIIYMPMVPEAVIAMLACARIGAIHSVVFGGFAANELAARIDDAKPKVIVTASCGIEPSRVVAYKPLLDEAITIAENEPDSCIILQRPQLEAELTSRDKTWSAVVDQAVDADCVPVQATDPLYILYTSGTTGEPKGIVRDNGGHAVALNWSMKNIYNIDAGDVYWAASDVGWVVGHSYIVYGPLFKGCTTLLYEGKPVGTPDPGAYWRVIEEHAVNVLFTAPTAIRAIKKEDPRAVHLGRYDTSCLKALFLAGERCDPDTLVWAQDQLNVPVIDHWWQTESGWPIVANCLGIEPLPVKLGSPTVPVPGYKIDVLDKSGRVLGPDQMGSIAIKLPLPPGTFPTLWENDQRYEDAYLNQYPGYYLTGDAGYYDEDGYIYIMGRTDDVINVAGHRLSTGALEEVIAAHSAVAECSVIGVNDALKGQLPLGLVVLKSCVHDSHDKIIDELVQSVRNQIGPVAAFKQAVVVERLPKTRSGKILRSTMRSIANGEEYKTPATIDDPEILAEIAQVLKSRVQ